MTEVKNPFGQEPIDIKDLDIDDGEEYKWWKLEKIGTYFAGVYQGWKEGKNQFDRDGIEPKIRIHKFEMIKGHEDVDVEKGNMIHFSRHGRAGKILNKSLEEIGEGEVVGLFYYEQTEKRAKLFKVVWLSDPKGEKYDEYKKYVDKDLKETKDNQKKIDEVL